MLEAGSLDEPAAGSAGLPNLAFPDTWAERLAGWHFDDADALVAAARDGRHQAEDLLGADELPAGQRFLERLRDALARNRAALVTYPTLLSVKTAAFLVGQLLGGFAERSVPPLREPVIFNRDARAAAQWHTDGVVWRQPAPWAVLGQVRPMPDATDLPTTILDLAHVVADWADDPQHLEVLRRTRVEWRTIPVVGAGRIPPLSAPVLDEHGVRWHATLRQHELASAEPDSFARACQAFRRALDASSGKRDIVVGPGTLLVWDNRRVVHHGPAVPDDSPRTMIVLSAGGGICD